MKALVTGGAGYIGSILVTRLIENGYEVNVIDDLSTGHFKNVDPKARFYFGSILNSTVLKAAMKDCEIVFHFAAKSLVAESMIKPDLYKQVNLVGSINILENMKEMKISKIIAASTAAVYQGSSKEALTENSRVSPGNPYGDTKLQMDEKLNRYCEENDISGVSFRFFNVSAPYFSKSLGWMIEDHFPETHLIPNLVNVSKSKLFEINGKDWDTEDKTCVRDYLHVKDLTDACINAPRILQKGINQIFNLGTKNGSSILQIVDSYEKIFEQKLEYKFVGRREGDVDSLVADSRKFMKISGWKPNLSIDDIFQDYKLAFGIK
jgi:UDP-glucose 4-epimerase